MENRTLHKPKMLTTIYILNAALFLPPMALLNLNSRFHFFPKISTFREYRFATTEDIQINGPQSLQVLSKKISKCSEQQIAPLEVSSDSFERKHTAVDWKRLTN